MRSGIQIEKNRSRVIAVTVKASNRDGRHLSLVTNPTEPNEKERDSPPHRTTARRGAAKQMRITMTRILSRLTPMFTAAIVAFAMLGQAPAQADQYAHNGPGSELAALIAGSTIYTDELTFYYPRKDVWKFSANGRVVANYTKTRTGYALTQNEEYGQDFGIWSVQGNALCLRFEAMFYGQVQCYVIRLVSYNEFGPSTYVANHVSKPGWRFKFTLAR